MRRARPRRPVCSTKSQRSAMPGNSTTRFSVSSPQRPRTSGRRSAVDRLRVSRCRRSCTFTRLSIWPESLAVDSRRSRSRASACSSCFASAILMGSISCSTPSSFLERGVAAAWSRPNTSRASLRKVSLLASSASARGAFDGRAHLRFALRSSSAVRARIPSSWRFSRARPRARRSALRARRAARRVPTR